jgi:hypothetical protein
MADPRKLPSLEQWAKELAEREQATLNPRPADIQNLDGLSRDSNPGGGGSQTIPGKPKQGPSPDNRGDGGSGVKEEGGASSQGDNRLSEPSAPLSPTIPATGASIFTSSDNVLKKIADRFNEAREIGKVQAWRQFQRDLMDASPYIVPLLIPYKDLVQLCADIEKEIKGSTSQAGKSNEELLADFLSGGASLPENIPVPLAPVDYSLEESLDTSDIVGKVDDGDSRENSIPPPIPPPSQP